MKVLAIETSSKVLGVAVLDEEGCSVEFNYNFELRHVSHLVPTIKLFLKFINLELKDIDAYCISIGPGSFTGLRIGITTIKALALVDKKKVVAVPSLDVLVHNIPHTENTICVIVDAKKEKLYSCFYEYRNADGRRLHADKRGYLRKSALDLRESVLKRISPYLLISYEELFKRLAKIKNDILLVGDGIEKIKNEKLKIKNLEKKIKFTDGTFWYPKAINVARIGLEMLKKGKVVKDINSLVPIYMHPRDVQCRKIKN